MRKFNGFSDGKPHLARIPSQFFHELLPLVDNLAELKVTLFCMWAIQQKEGDYKYLRYDELAGNQEFLQGLQGIEPESEPLQILDDGLDRAVNRGTLLTAQIVLYGENVCYYVVNSERGRMLIDQFHSGDWRPVSKNEVEILPARPTIFAMYEENVGVLTPMIVDSLKDAEAEYSVEWVEDAIKIAVEANVRQWRYIIKILESWKQKGRSHETNQGHAEPHEKYLTGEWADFIES